MVKRLLFFLVLLPLTVNSQNTIGLPDVINYAKGVYGAGFQNWDIKQDKNGIIYFANNEGLLSFDGRNWNLYPLPNRTIVRSVEIGADNHIYVGGQDELGYFSPSLNGRLEYHSLTRLIPANDRSFGDVWDIVSFNKDIFFRSTTKIFRFNNQSVATFNAPSEWAYLGVSNNQLFAQDLKTGLMSFTNNIWSPLPLKSKLPIDCIVTSVLTLQNDSTIITTLKNGLYFLSKEQISKIQSSNSALFENERIYAATTINDDWIALATNNGGIYIVDLKENIIQHFSRTEGLQNNNVLSIFLDTQHNLWLGLDNGIDFIAINSSIKHITPLLQDASGYTAIVFNDHLFAGTSNGLYSVPLQNIKDLSFSKGDFVPVQGTIGQTWSLTNINNQLILGHHEGAFIIKENKALPISSQSGFWNFIPLSSTFPAKQIISGNYKGLIFFDYINQQFLQSKEIPGFNESSRFIAIDKYENTWVSHPYHGVYRISKNNDGTYTTNTYADNKGLPSALNNHVYKVKNEIAIATEKGVFEYNQAKDLFEPNAYYRKLLGDMSIRYLKEDMAGNIWFIHEKKLGVIDISGKEPIIIYLPELNNKMVSGFEFIYAVDEKNIFLGGEKGFYHINYENYKKTVPHLKVQVRSVRIINKSDSLLFGGYFSSVNEIQVQDEKNIPSISKSWKTIHIDFASSQFGNQSNLEYSYRLKGFDNNWFDWSNRTEKEYTNLPPGNYVFEVKVRSNLVNESPVATYSFKVLPPWYKTYWAYLFYVLLLGSAVFIVDKWQRKKYELKLKKYEDEQKKLLYIHELERNKTEAELIKLKNEKLETDIGYKNSELASSAMHLVKKGELLTKIKGDLLQVIKKTDNENAIFELKKMIKSLSEDDNIDQEWGNFTKHFDNVHSDFVSQLKEKHPSISGNELKLCAYLRMNLSTKEIAQLMNISVRGVEISRYRLRKKLGISTEVSLFDYLINNV